MPECKIKELPSLLSEALGEEIEVLEEKSKFLTPPGEHYGSIMLSLDVVIRRSASGKSETLNLVAKMPPASEMLKTCFDIGVTFKKELDSYAIMIPALQEFQRDYNVPEERIIDIFPKYYGGRINLNGSDVVDDDALLLFENLKVKGYDTEDRFIGFDLESAQMIVQDLAKFHAIPIAMRILRPNDFKEKVGPTIVPNSGIETLPEEVGSAFVDSVIEVSKTIPELANYLTKIQENVRIAEENAANKNIPPPNPIYATAAHSDYWVNNTMIKKDPKTGKIVSNKMVDLQIMQYNSALVDLVFFLFTSVVNEVLDVHCDALIKLYYDTFIEYLKDFKVDLAPYNWSDFLQEVDSCAHAEFYHVAFMLK